MSKKTKTNAKPLQKTVAAEPVATPVIDIPKKPLTIFNFKVQAIIVAALAFILYFNSFFNEYAHDDGIVIVKNEYVLEGVDGLHDIFTKDAYDSYYKQLNTVNALSGGRYRPLSIATFALEQQFFGAVSKDDVDSVLKSTMSYGVRGANEQKLVFDMHIRHVINVLWYMLSVVVLLYFFRYIVFKNNVIMAFIAAIIFTVHPIHTEVVANVKSRDEIMSLLFICLTFILAFKYRETKKLWILGAALLSYFLAFLSKEYAITLVVLLPMAFCLFDGDSITKSLKSFAPYLIVVVGYAVVRFALIIPMKDWDYELFSKIHTALKGAGSDEVLNNPYLFATKSQKVATEIATSLNYIKLLIFPSPLSADYSYNQIPYKSFSDVIVWLSIIIHSTLFIVMIAQIKKRPVISFAIAFYLLHLMLVNNMVFDIGATMGERLIFHSSVGFSIVVAYLLVKGYERIQPATTAKYALAGFMGIIVLLSGYKTIARNADWKNDKTLFMQDVKTVPNSVLANANVAASLISMADLSKDEKQKKADLNEAIGYLDKAISMHRKFVAGYLNRGLAYYKLGDINLAKANMDSVKKYYPSYPTLPTMYKLLSDHYNTYGWNQYGKVGKYPEAIAEFKKGIAIDSTNVELWYNLGGAYFSNKQYNEAVQAWTITLRLKPDYAQAQGGYRAAMGILGKLPPPPQPPAKR